jgi:hypothetical protein
MSIFFIPLCLGESNYDPNLVLLNEVIIGDFIVWENMPSNMFGDTLLPPLN